MSLAARHHPAGRGDNMRKGPPQALWPQGGCGRAGQLTHGAPDPGGLTGVVARMRRHAQVRRATYTYGVIPQDVQLLHQLRDQDVLERQTCWGERQPGGSTGCRARGRGAYRYAFRFAVGLEGALPFRERGVVEVDGGRLPLPFLGQKAGGWRGAVPGTRK